LQHEPRMSLVSELVVNVVVLVDVLVAV